MGNGVNFTDADASIEYLANRNYPESFAPNGSKCGKIKICIPDIFLMGENSVKFISMSEKSITVNSSNFLRELSNPGKLMERIENNGTNTTLVQNHEL